jgi:YidC/Oxa1 family membrane protein insertase
LDTILSPLYYAVSGIIVILHRAFTAIGMPPNGGWAWGLSIVGLVIIIRILLIPLFVKQIRSTRNMQVLQPKMREIQQKYKDDKERQSQELMKLYRETGTNPFSSCLPIIAQAPIFLALFRVLDGIAKDHPRGFITEALIASAQHAKIFGAEMSASFVNSPGNMTVKIVTMTMVVIMAGSQFIAQRQLMLKNLSPDAASNPFIQQQKMLLYILPLVMGVSGFFFPVGVLLYWLVSNFWTIGQQMYVIRHNPTPGSIAHKEMEARRAAKAKKRDANGGEAVPAEATPPAAKTATPRNQPQRVSRSKRTSGKKKR